MDSCLLECRQCQPTPHWYFVLLLIYLLFFSLNLQLSIMIFKVSYPPSGLKSCVNVSVFKVCLKISINVWSVTHCFASLDKA